MTYKRKYHQLRLLFLSLLSKYVKIQQFNTSLLERRRGIWLENIPGRKLKRVYCIICNIPLFLSTRYACVYHRYGGHKAINQSLSQGSSSWYIGTIVRYIYAIASYIHNSREEGEGGGKERGVRVSNCRKHRSVRVNLENPSCAQVSRTYTPVCVPIYGCCL